MKQLLLFDLDGTLTDPSDGIFNCIRYAFECLDTPAPTDEQLRTWVGPPLLDSFASVLGSDALAERALAAYRERFSDVGLFENQLIDGIEPLLAQLNRAGHRCVVATAKPTVYSDRIIDHFGLREWLPVVYGSELDGTRTNKSELIAYIMARETKPVGGAVMVGDRKHDVVGAKHNGLVSIGVLWGFGDEPELSQAGAERIATTVADLGEYLLSS